MIQKASGRLCTRENKNYVASVYVSLWSLLLIKINKIELTNYGKTDIINFTAIWDYMPMIRIDIWGNKNI